MAANYEEGVSKHREFLRNRQRSSDEDKGYPRTRSAKEIVKGKDVKGVSQRRGISDEPVKVQGLRDKFKKRNRD